jgi:hypothetical protein
MMAKRTKKSQSEQAAEIKAAADKAEARSTKAPKAQTVKVAAPKGSNDDQDRALFLHHLQNLPKLIKAKDDAVNAIRGFYKKAKADGFVQDDFKEALKMQGVEGEKEKKSAIARSLRIARWLGLDLGAQLDMFEQDERVPAADRAYEEGKSQAMLGISLKTDYAPETEQFREFTRGWHDGQAILSQGFKKLHPEVAADEKAKIVKKAVIDVQKAEDEKVFDAPASGVAMTRAEYAAQQAAQKPN